MKELNIYCSIDTGDRKRTAIAITKETHILQPEIVDFDTFDSNSFDNLQNKTLIFNSKNIGHPNNQEYLIKCKNFIVYNLIPNDKLSIVQV